MTLQEQIESLEQAGKSDSEIAATLSALTVRDLPVDAVRLFLRESRLWMKDPITRARDRGNIGVAMLHPDFPTALYDALVDLEAALYDESASHLSCRTRPDIAVQIAATLQALRLAGVINESEVTAFYAIGGGLRHPDFTAAKVAEARTIFAEAAADQARIEGIEALLAEIENTWLNPAVSDGVTDAATVRAAIKAGL